MNIPIILPKYPAFFDPNEDIKFWEYEEYLLGSPNQLYEWGRYPIKHEWKFIIIDPEQTLPFHILWWEPPAKPPMKCWLIHLFVHYLFWSLYDLIGEEGAIEKFRFLKNYLDFWENFNNKSLPMMELYLIVGGKWGLFAYFFEDRMWFWEEEFMQKSPYTKQQLSKPHIRISLEEWRNWMYGEEVMEELRKKHFSKQKENFMEQAIDDLHEMINTLNTFKFNWKVQNGVLIWLQGHFKTTDTKKYCELKEYVSDGGYVAVDNHKWTASHLVGEKRFRYEKPWNQSKKK